LQYLVRPNGDISCQNSLANNYPAAAFRTLYIMASFRRYQLQSFPYLSCFAPLQSPWILLPITTANSKNL